ncbi:hypothetical protein WS105_0768 [Weissella ceti]|nr:hypothetical protein WS105_0768 [Weissella ceti]
MSVLLVIILIFLAIGLYVRYKARTMMARLREQITVYGLMVCHKGVRR